MKLYYGMKPYRFSFKVDNSESRLVWIRFYGEDMETAFADSKAVALRENPTAHSFMIESDQDDAQIRRSWGLPE